MNKKSSPTKRTDKQILESSLIKDAINLLEDAETYFRLITEFNYTQEMVENILISGISALDTLTPKK